MKVLALGIISIMTIASFATITIATAEPPLPNPNPICFNRHNSSIRNIVLSDTLVNYTDSGSIVSAKSYHGYTVDVILQVSPGVIDNPSPSGDLSNGSLFLASDVYGSVQDWCIYNVPIEGEIMIALAKPANITGLQTVIWSNGTILSQYNISWVGP